MLLSFPELDLSHKQEKREQAAKPKDIQIESWVSLKQAGKLTTSHSSKMYKQLIALTHSHH